MRDLLRRAAGLGVSVHLAHLDDPELLGYYDQKVNIIVLAIGMTRVQTHCVLAHELAHAMLGHTHTSGPAERRADQLAASMLINADAYRRAESIAHDEASIAAELGVTIEVVRDYKRLCLQRIGDRTYLRPRLGRGQYLAATV